MFQLLQAMFSSIAETWHEPKMQVRAATPKTQNEKSINSVLKVKGDDSYAGDIHILE